MGNTSRPEYKGQGTPRATKFESERCQILTEGTCRLAGATETGRGCVCPKQATCTGRVCCAGASEQTP